VYRYARFDQGFSRVLECGCGAGANIPFFIKLGVEYFGVDGSTHIVSTLHKQYPDLKDRIAVGDFTRAIPFAQTFDLAVDRAAITHNTTEAIRRALMLVFGRLRSGGKIIGIDWFAADHSDASEGERADPWTRTNIIDGSFADVGVVHFSDSDHLVNLLESAGFAIERLEHKQTETMVPKSANRIAAWNFVAVKP
jgi:SAM-dependent methyltransferase